ncbi:glycosyltransferase, partial [Providencia rettgeri]|uniref:glycosyltransferase n=3 Tax=Morganellaceae TaxID=1903414 RepID=UPI001EE72E86
PGVFSYILSIYYRIFNISYSLEVVTNPLQEASSLTKNKFISYCLSKVFISIFKTQLNKCNYASFVTNFEIQNKFLSSDEINSNKFNSSYSSIILEENDFASTDLMKNRIHHYDSLDKINLLFIGVLDRPFKGLDIFINLLNTLPDKYSATIVGDGHLINKYKKMAQDLNLSERIVFKGYISDKQIKRKIMTSSDLFVLTSRREGLPRVVIEAMAWGLPCVCSDVSGVRELIDDEYIFPINSYTCAKNIICNLTSEDLVRISNKNIQKAISYKDTFLKKRRFDFYQKVISSESSTFK